MNDLRPIPTPDHQPDRVRTLSMVPSCPICGQPLRGRQTVCSGRCRIDRSRRRRSQKKNDQDAKIRLLLHEALHLLSETTS